MPRRWFFVPVVFLLFGTLFFTSCDDFLSKSWGSGRKYDYTKIDLNSRNLDSWIDTAVGNPELAHALTEKIKTDVTSGKLSPADQVQYQRAGVTLAVEATGLGTSIIANASGAVGDIQDKNPDAVIDILNNIRGDFNANNGVKAANDIAVIVGVSIDSMFVAQSGIPRFNDGYDAAATPSEVAQAVLVLTVAVFEDLNDQINDTESLWDLINNNGVSVNTNTNPPTITVDEDEIDPKIIALAAYLNLIASGGGKFENNPITSAIRDAFGLR
jgi:hypothetical protein